MKDTEHKSTYDSNIIKANLPVFSNDQGDETIEGLLVAKSLLSKIDNYDNILRIRENPEHDQELISETMKYLDITEEDLTQYSIMKNKNKKITIENLNEQVLTDNSFSKEQLEKYMELPKNNLNNEEIELPNFGKKQIENSSTIKTPKQK
jgi:hypothetical protein